MLDPYILSPVLNSLSFGISEFHLRMRQICRPNKLYNYPEQTPLQKNIKVINCFNLPCVMISCFFAILIY
jgi:hypothetical protein